MDGSIAATKALFKTMQKRRSHKKSRNGCQNCKKWHTKCDEQGPPCNNCTLRKAKCVYNRPKVDNIRNSDSLTIRSKNASSVSWPVAVDRPQGDVGALCGAYGGPSRLMELELMHQWSTNTYKAFCGIPEDGNYLQVLLPRYALEYDYMLNCILAISSLQIAKLIGEGNSTKYINAGLEYYNRGSSSFRSQLISMNADNCHVLYMFSAIAIAAQLSIPHRSGSALDLLIIALDLLIGSTNIGMMGMPWLLNSPFPLRLFISRMGASKDLIDLDSRLALARLHAINEQRNKATSEPVSGDEEADGVLLVRDYELYRMSIDGLEMCFAEEARGVLRGFSTAFPGLAGKPFSSLISKFDPFALLIIMHWTVLLSQLDESIWWAKSIAEGVALEIAGLLRTRHPDLALEWAEPISWALNRLGFSTPQSRELSYSSGLDSNCWEIT
ncbi:hypothetical protein F5Y06DRAFT_305345 [Hypoxylon sp. FL0890]|nr:hypothetical protein F5Y06DRAFT_305345 [Hypoxylon sp. FL0890]